MLFELYLSFFQIGSFSFGGGLAALSLLHQVIIEQNAWLTMEDFGNLVSIAEITPGPIAINSASFVGMKLGGIVGTVIATLGFITPSVIIISILAYIYTKYHDLQVVKDVLKFLRLTVVALLATAGLKISKHAFFAEANQISLEALNYVNFLLFLIAFLLIRKKLIKPIYAILTCGLVSVIYSLIF